MFLEFRQNSLTRLMVFVCMALVVFQLDTVQALANNATAKGTRFYHDPYSYMVPGKRITIQVAISDPAGVRIARCYFKASGEEDYVFVPMEKVDGTLTLYKFVLPAPSPGSKGIHYRLLVVNKDGKISKTDEFMTPVRAGITPGWQEKAQSTASIKVGAEVARQSDPNMAVGQPVAGFADTIALEVVESAGRFMAVSNSAPVAAMAATPTVPVPAADAKNGAAPSTIMGLKTETFWWIVAGVGVAAVGAAVLAASSGGGGGGGNANPGREFNSILSFRPESPLMSIPTNRFLRAVW